MRKFNKGLVVGGFLGAGLMWLNTTKKGRDFRAQIMEAAHTVYEQIEEEILSSKQWDTMTKSAFVKRVQELVNTYAIENGMADSVKKLVEKIVVSQFASLKKKAKSKK